MTLTMTNFNCKPKNKQTKIEGRGRLIQIDGHGRQIQIWVGDQGWGPGNTKIPNCVDFK